jgi:hypothetical protein
MMPLFFKVGVVGCCCKVSNATPVHHKKQDARNEWSFVTEVDLETRTTNNVTIALSKYLFTRTNGAAFVAFRVAPCL